MTPGPAASGKNGKRPAGTTPDKRRGLFLFWAAAAARQEETPGFWEKFPIYAKLAQKTRKKLRKIYEDCKAVFGVGPKNGFFVKRVSFLRYKTAKFTKICLERR